MHILSLLYLLAVGYRVTCQSENCNKLKAFKVLAKSEKELKLFDELTREASKLQIKIERPLKRHNSSYIFTAPNCKHQEILTLFKMYEILDYEVFDPKLANDEISLQRSNSVLSFDPEIVSKEYLSHNETNTYIEEIAKRIREANPMVSAEIINEGFSIEHRTIKSVTVKYNQSKREQENPIVFIDAGSHAREWHSRSMALFFLRKLIDEAALNTNGIIYSTTFVILPSVNPDGYEFSRKGDKMWRKTRNPVTKKCIGVDINRNYDSHWYLGKRELYPCSETYRGRKPFSEPETQIVRNIMERTKENCKMYIAIHTFGNTIIYPYGYTTKKHPRQALLQKVAQAGVDAVAIATGGVFKADQSGSSLYVAAGGSDDYAMDVAGIPFAYTFELGAEEYGFSVPLEHLKHTLQEGFIALKAMILQVMKM